MPIIVERINYTYMAGSNYSYQALRDVSFTVEEGEFLGIIGHTGSGKSTLVQHLNGLVQPTSGRVLVDGLDMADKKLRIQGRAKVGMVFQYPEYQLFEETVAKDIAFGPRNMGLSEEEIAERVNEALLLVGLSPEEFAEKSPFELSGGEKRRVALAGMVAMRPKYLVMDEPMAGLDPRGRKAILDMIVHLREKTGCAIVMVSHSMDDVSRHAERILVLNEGEVVMLDTPAAIFRQADRLTEIGLSIPQASQIALALRARGVDVPEGIFRMQDLVAFLKGVLPHVR